MRRAEREVTDIQDILAILKKAIVCRLAFQSEGAPYVVPLSFGFALEEDRTVAREQIPLRLFFHCALEGRKLDCLRANNLVGFELDNPGEIKAASRPCGYTQSFESLIGQGRLNIIEDAHRRIFALNRLMEHYGAPIMSSDPDDLTAHHEYNPKVLQKTCLLQLDVTEICGKRLAP